VGIPTANPCRLSGWWIPAAATPAPAVILVHGWSRNGERMLPYVGMLRDSGYHLLVFDARHHGASDADGHASMKKFSEDIRAVVDHLANRPEVDASRLAVVGLSVGGSAAIHAAAHDPRIRAVVTVGAFAHPRDAMLEMGLGNPLLAPAMPLTFRFLEWRIGARFDQLAPERHVARINGPVFVIHGENDRVVPVAHADRLMRAAGAGAELWRIPGRGHSDTHLEPGFAPRLVSFLAGAFAVRPTATQDNDKAGAA
jgi:pimeloyl-ACP methyl ester carboxylesterase